MLYKSICLKLGDTSSVSKQRAPGITRLLALLEDDKNHNELRGRLHGLSLEPCHYLSYRIVLDLELLQSLPRLCKIYLKPRLG